MRIKVNFHAENNVSFPIEYNYNIYCNIKQILFDYLENKKPKQLSKFKRTLPAFSFSQLMIPERRIEPGFIEILGNYLSLFITSTDLDFIEYLVKAFNSTKSFPLFEHQLKLKKIEVLEPPPFTEHMRFKMISPMLLVKIENKKPRYLLPDDPDLGQIFATQLVGDYNRYRESNFKTSDIKILPDQAYVERKRNLTKAITVHNVHYRAMLFPFALAGDIELIKFAYNNGVGSATHYGFGMIESV